MPKVASSSLSEVVIPHLKELKAPKKFPFPQAEVWARAGRMRDREEYLSQYNTTTTFFITRHPLARLASAYRNKLQPDTRMEEYFIKTYGRAISEAARGSWREGDPDPTFPEFVRYLIKTEVKKYDEHWQPIALRCRSKLSKLVSSLRRTLECVSCRTDTSCCTRVSRTTGRPS